MNERENDPDEAQHLTLVSPGESTGFSHSNGTDGHSHVVDDKPQAEENCGDGIDELRQSLLPPLPPRPNASLGSRGGSIRLSRKPSRPELLSRATTALSLADVHGQTGADVASLTSSPGSRTVSRKHSLSNLGRFTNPSNSEAEDSASLMSFAPISRTPLASSTHNIDDVTNEGSPQPADSRPAHSGFVLHPDSLVETQIINEFDVVNSTCGDGASDDTALQLWKSKLKHFFILSASGKPIYSRHGDDKITSHYIGVAQALIASYQGSNDSLKGFTAGGTRFVVVVKDPLNLVAISRLGESDLQLRNQLESLYMQILSTLTLPSMEKMFSLRPSTDLRRSLQGTDVLLDGLADGFTRGSISTLISSLECLRLRKTDRRAINDALLAVRSPELLYGLVVTNGRLISVLRPKKHSLHPSDLHLIHNMLFGAGSIKAEGGENWIPLCLPGFNNTGYVYMYVSFLSEGPSSLDTSTQEFAGPGPQNDIVIVFISPSKEAFYSLRSMRDDFITQLRKTKTLMKLQDAIRKPRLSCDDLFPNNTLKHFVYKSRGNVQYVMSSYMPYFPDLVARRRLISIYGHLHESIHSRASHLKVQHMESLELTGLAWETSLFELYCVADPGTSRATIAQAANRLVQWVRREEERLFIIGGAVF